MMKSVAFTLLMLLLLVKEAFAEFKVTNLCSEEECGCKKPKDPESISLVYTKKYSIHYGCICLCGCLGGEECTVDADCIPGFACNPAGRSQKKVCTCPCDDLNDPYCPSPYSSCSMNDTTPTCNCQLRYRCKTEIEIPKCVIYGDDTVYEYKNPCFFVTESCDKTKNDIRWRDYPYGCKHVPNLLDSVMHEYWFPPGKVKYVLAGSALAAVGWDPSVSGNLGIPEMYVQPEPEPEPEQPSF